MDRAKLMPRVRAAFELEKQHASNFIYRPTVVWNMRFTIALTSAGRRQCKETPCFTRQRSWFKESDGRTVGLKIGKKSTCIFPANDRETLEIPAESIEFASRALYCTLHGSGLEGHCTVKTVSASAV